MQPSWVQCAAGTMGRVPAALTKWRSHGAAELRSSGADYLDLDLKQAWFPPTAMKTMGFPDLSKIEHLSKKNWKDKLVCSSRNAMVLLVRSDFDATEYGTNKPSLYTHFHFRRIFHFVAPPGGKSLVARFGAIPALNRGIKVEFIEGIRVKEERRRMA
jgi:hypothetical protein